MTINYTALLGLAEPVTGTQSGTWGDDVNKGITDYLDVAIAGTQTISGTQTAVTLSLTNGSSAASNIAQVGTGATGSAQFAVINCTGNPASLLTITVPASSRQYTVINATSTSQSVKVVGVGPTTGVTVVSGERAVVAWNGSDFVKVASTVITDLTGTLAVANGGTGATSLTANNVILGNGTSAVQTVAPGTSGNILTSNGTTWTSAAAPTSMVYPGAGIPVSTGSAWNTSFTNSGNPITVGYGGTGLSSTPSNGQIDIGNGTGFTRTTITAGTGISITNGSGSITIATAGGGGSSTGATMYLAANFGAF